MTADTDADLFAFLYAIAAGVRTLRSQTRPGAVPDDGDEVGEDPAAAAALPDLSRLAAALDHINEQLDGAETRVLDLGQELADHASGVEAKRATHDAVRSLLGRLADVRGAVEELRSFDYREGALHDFLADQRRSLAKVRKTIDAMDAASLRAVADRELTMHRLRSGLASGTTT